MLQQIESDSSKDLYGRILDLHFLLRTQLRKYTGSTIDVYGASSLFTAVVFATPDNFEHYSRSLCPWYGLVSHLSFLYEMKFYEVTRYARSLPIDRDTVAS